VSDLSKQQPVQLLGYMNYKSIYKYTFSDIDFAVNWYFITAYRLDFLLMYFCLYI